MSQNRLDQLLRYYEEDPNDPFTLYAIATEYRFIDLEKSLFYYQKLLSEHPDYIGTYYHAGKLYAEMGLFDQAEETFQKGIELSKARGERNAHRELQAAYREFLDEREE